MIKGITSLILKEKNLLLKIIRLCDFPLLLCLKYESTILPLSLGIGTLSSFWGPWFTRSTHSQQLYLSQLRVGRGNKDVCVGVLTDDSMFIVAGRNSHGVVSLALFYTQNSGLHDVSWSEHFTQVNVFEVVWPRVFLQKGCFNVCVEHLNTHCISIYLRFSGDDFGSNISWFYS